MGNLYVLIYGESLSDFDLNLDLKWFLIQAIGPTYQVRKSPDISDADGQADAGEDELPFRAPLLPLVIVVVVWRAIATCWQLQRMKFDIWKGFI